MTYSPGDTLLEKYRIEALIGRGAFAEVFCATHIDLNVLRALKVLLRDNPGVGSSLFDDYEHRFRLEFQLGGRLNHPNVIQVYDVDRDHDDLILVMEYAPKGSLAERIQRARDQGELVDIDEALKIAVEVSRGIGKIHSLDAVHRDLKPSNILFDAENIAKVADLGLAQIPGGPSMRSQLSQPVRHPGTAGYMSPEQEHSTAFLSPASDIYALGVILFELLTGRHINYVPKSTQVSDLRAEVPGELDELVQRLLSQDADQRPFDGNQAAQQLEHILDRILEESEASAKREQLRLERDAAEQRKRQQKEARQKKLAEERANKAAARAQIQAERKTRWSRFLSAMRDLISSFGRKYWWLVAIIIILIGVSVGLRRQYLAHAWPFLPTMTATSTSTQTLTSSPTNTRTASPRPTETDTPRPTETFTQTQIPSPTITLTPTPSPSKTFTKTPKPTATVPPPTATPTASKTLRPTRTPSPTLTPIPSSAILYSEDFENDGISGWDIYYSTWNIKQESSGNHYWRGTGPNNYPQTWYDHDGWTNFAFEVRFRFADAPGENQIFICTRTSGGSSFYTATLSTNGWYHLAVYDGTSYEVIEDGSKTFLKSKWYLARVEVIGNTIRVYVDNKLLLTAQDDTLSSGSIGFYMLGNNVIDIDDMRVWSLDGD